MNFGLSTLFSDTGNKSPESFSIDSQILLFPKDIPAKLHEYELTTLSINNGQPEKFLINYKQKILLKLFTIKYRDRPASVFVNNYVIQIKHLIIACKYDFINTILKIIFSTRGDPFSFVSSKIKSYFMEQKHPENLKIESKVMKLWECNFSQVQSRIKKYTNEYNLNDRIFLKPNNTVFYNSLLSLKNRIMQFLKCNKYHFANYSTVVDSNVIKPYNMTGKKSVNQCTKAIQVIHNKSISISGDKLELFSWVVAISIFNRNVLESIIPEDLMLKIKKFSDKPKVQPIDEGITFKQKRQTMDNKTSITKKLKNQTSIVNYFKPIN